MPKKLTERQHQAFHVKPITRKRPKKRTARDIEHEEAIEFDQKMAVMRATVRARMGNSEGIA